MKPPLVVYRCDCGQWSGARCDWTGSFAETVIVEWMPVHLRASHETAGNSGVYPLNGAVRLRVERSCAERMIENDGEWCSIVEGS